MMGISTISCFQKSVCCAGIDTFNTLPLGLTSLRNEKTQFKVALRRYLNTRSLYCVDEWFLCKDGRYFCIWNLCSTCVVIIMLSCIFSIFCMFDLFHALLSFWQTFCGMYIFFFFFFHWHNSPLWALACQTMSFNFFVSATDFIFSLPAFEGLFLLPLSRMCVYIYIYIYIYICVCVCVCT